jgi:hypothetical protein
MTFSSLSNNWLQPGRPSNLGSICCSGRNFSLIPSALTASSAHSTFCSMGSRGKSSQGVKLSTLFYTVPRLRLRGAVLPSLLHIYRVVSNEEELQFQLLPLIPRFMIYIPEEEEDVSSYWMTSRKQEVTVN